MQRISEEELFPIKSAAAKRAGETKKACKAIEDEIKLAIHWFVNAPSSWGPLGCLPDHGSDVISQQQSALKKFKALLIKRAQSLNPNVVIRRRQGGLVFETRVTLENIRDAKQSLINQANGGQA